jgi:3-oxoacyl-[acyl-carrier-protein] synthase-3
LNSSIQAISYSLPAGTLTNADLCAAFPELNENEIYKRTGIRKRHIVAKDELASDMAVVAANKLFAEHGIDKSKIDFILFCSHCFDYKGPATAVLLQERLNLKNDCGALDIPLGCSGFTHSLGVAKALISSGQASNVLLITADIPSSVVHPKDSGLRMLFGDAAAATLVTSSGADQSSIGQFVYGTDGSGKKNLMVHRSATRHPADSDWLNSEESAFGILHYGRMEMNAAEIFSFALRVVPPLKDAILAKNNLSADDIDLYIFHQANGFLLKMLQRKMKIPEEKFLMFMEDVGNTVSASIPIVLSEAIRSGKAKKGDKILIAGFGIGYSWSGTVVTL